MGPILSGYGIMSFNSRKRPPVNRASQLINYATLNQLAGDLSSWRQAGSEAFIDLLVLSLHPVSMRITII